MAKPKALAPLGKQAVADPDVVANLLWSLTPENHDTRRRERAFKSLMRLAASRPEVLWPHWTALTRLLRSRSASSKFPAVHILAALVPHDRAHRFDRVLGSFLALLDDEAISVAGHVAALAGEIARARPDLEPRITRRLLALDDTHFDAGRRDLVKSYALQAFDLYAAESKDRRGMLAFASGMLRSSSPRAKSTARKFLRKWDGS